MVIISCNNFIAKTDSEEVGLPHDAHELLLSDLAIAVAVGFLDHFHNLVVGHVLAELLGDTLKVLKTDFASLVVVEQPESLKHFLLGVAVGHLGGHHLEELGEVNHAGAVLVDLGDELFNLLALGLEAECAHGNFELFLVDVARTIGVEEVKGFFDFLLLLLGELSSLLGAVHLCFLEGSLYRLDGGNLPLCGLNSN